VLAGGLEPGPPEPHPKSSPAGNDNSDDPSGISMSSQNVSHIFTYSG